MEFTGKVIKAVVDREGSSFPHIDIVVENTRTVGDKTFVDGVVVTFGRETMDKLDARTYREGAQVKIEFNPSCREWKGKYYQSLWGRSVELVGEKPEPAPAPVENKPKEPAFNPGPGMPEQNDDLPF